ncbi:isochorismate synthase [Murinocardiopsis flavida]|uniref:isochorismate synthase n=1 Tax=Murinocardiopsis flavida TaxID=645275 RepID=A0A2P8DSB6_9ACTN|nr:isochorismate synthase [Murinocardiopsis flavida]PSL00114.1 isochorismate synthase [Murinocardiopsis flavida]
MNAPPQLFVRSVPLPDDRDLLAHLPDDAPLAWLHGGSGLVAWGEAARVVLPARTEPGDVQRFTAAARWFAGLEPQVDDQVRRPGSGLMAFGSFAFDPRSDGSTLVVPRVAVGRDRSGTWLTTIGDQPGRHPAELLAPHAPPRPVGPLRWTDGARTAEDWGTQVATAVRRIRGGAYDKVVLARDRYAEAESPIDPRTLLARLAADYPTCYAFTVDGLTGATPELLIRREGEDLTSLVLAGTAPRGGTEVEDRRLGQDLAESAKNAEEHRYAVDSLRDRLAPLCTAFDAPDRPELLRLANVQHLASPVRATLRPGASTLDVVAAMHPTAAVGGTPTEAAVEAIRGLEGMDRGRYAGPVGWIDADGNGEWGIALRCAQLDGPRARLIAGCGIVAGSRPEEEITEADAKFEVMRAALTDGE